MLFLATKSYLDLAKSLDWPLLLATKPLEGQPIDHSITDHGLSQTHSGFYGEMWLIVLREDRSVAAVEKRPNATANHRSENMRIGKMSKLNDWTRGRRRRSADRQASSIETEKFIKSSAKEKSD